MPPFPIVQTTPLRVRATGGSYVDELSGDSNTIAAETPLRAVANVPAGANSVTVAATVPTTVAAELADDQGLTAANITAANNTVANTVLGIAGDSAGDTMLATIPADSTKADSATADSTALSYGLVAAATSGDIATLITDMTTDLADGLLDTQSAALQQNVTSSAPARSATQETVATSGIVNTLTAAADGDLTDLAESNSHDITAFQIANQLDSSVDVGARTVTVLMPAGTDVTALSSTIATSLGASVPDAATAARDYTTAQEVVVTAADDSSSTWTVTVTLAADGGSPVASITEVPLTEQILAATINADEQTVTMEVATDAMAALDDRSNHLVYLC